MSLILDERQTALPLPDIQRTPDAREVAISRVGVTGIRLPIRVKRAPSSVSDPDPLLPYLDTVGTFEVACSIAAEVKGTHMSRFTEVLNHHVSTGGVFSIEDLQTVTVELVERLETNRVYLKLEVDYFMPQPSPVTERPGTAPLKGILEVDCKAGPDGEFKFVTHTGVKIQGKTCCPCSREISDYDRTTGMGKGAHAQRSNISIRAAHGSKTTIWFEELVQAAWRSFSVPVYPVLKRPDERHVTMWGYDNPKFVEDVVRDVTIQLRQMPKVTGFEVRVVNEESIHYHDAYAQVEEYK